jgi:hypothetical protein
MTQASDLSAFRGGLQSEHENFAAGMAGRKNTYLSNLANTRAGFSEKLGEVQSRLGQAEELLKSGLESEGAVGGAYIASKTGLKAYRYFKGTHTLDGKLTDKGLAQSQEAGNTTAQEGNPSGDTTDVARPNNPNVNDDFQQGQGQEMRSTEMTERGPGSSSNQFTRDGYDDTTGLRTSPQADPTDGSVQDNFGPNSEGYGDVTTSTETKVADGLGDATDAVDDVTTTASDALSTATSAGADALSSATSGASDALSAGLSAATDTALDAAAGAFSWVPFLGEILGGAAAIAGIGTAIAGGVETGMETAKENATQAAAAAGIGAAEAARPVNRAMNYAGGYVAPAASSIQT